ETIMRIRRGQVAAGLLFVVVGAGRFWLAADDPMRTAQRPGTSVLPSILSWCLIATGWALWPKAALIAAPGLTGWAQRPRDWACCPDGRKSTVSGMEMHARRRLLKACTARAVHIATPGLAAAATRRVRAFP